MPVPALKGIAKRSGKSLQTIERYWKEARKSKPKNGGDPWAYRMGIVKRRAFAAVVSNVVKRLKEGEG